MLTHFTRRGLADRQPKRVPHVPASNLFVDEEFSFRMELQLCEPDLGLRANQTETRLKKSVWRQSKPAKLSIPDDLPASSRASESAPRVQVPATELAGTYRIVSTCGTKGLAKR